MSLRSLISTVCGVLLLCHVSTAALPFPSSPDWKPLSDTVSYTTVNLWEHNDGAADQYIEYGMQYCAVGEFQTGNISFSVEVYDMGDILNAFGIYQVKSRGIQSRIKIGVESAVTLPSQCMMFKDKYFVIIYVFTGVLSETQAESLLTVTAAALPGTGQLPEALKLLPEINQLPHSSGYSRSAYAGVPGLNNCLFASYLDSSGETYQYFVIIPLDSIPAAQLFESLQDWQTQTAHGISFKYRPLSGKEFIGVAVSDRYLKGVTGASSPDLLQKRLAFLCRH